jgi:hypothetical protein
MNTTFSGEVRFKSYADSSSSGARVTFTLDDRDHLAKFVGLEGKRYMLAIVEIGDDEKPAQKEPVGDLCRWAVQRCKEELFQRFADRLYVDQGLNLPVFEDREKFCREVILAVCSETSRKNFDINPYSGERFKELIMRPYQRYYLAAGGARAGL